MSGELFLCIVGAIIALGVLIYVAMLLRSIPQARLFKTWAEISTAWRQTQDLFEKLIFLGVLAFDLCRGAALVLGLTVIGAAANIGTSMCGVAPESWPHIRAIIERILEWLSRALGLPPAPAHSPTLAP
jgi:hypothetical protein